MNCKSCKFFQQSPNFHNAGYCKHWDERVLGSQGSCTQAELPKTLAHTQLAANSEKVGGWDNAIAIANCIESGNHNQLRELVAPYPNAWGLIERIVTVSASHR